MTRALPTMLLLLFVTFTAATAHAKTRVTIHEFFGPHGGVLRTQAEQLLRTQADVEVISKSEIDAAASNLGIDVLSPAGRKTMSRELQLSAWVTGIVRKQAGSLRLTVVVYDGAEHANMGQAVLVGRSAQILSGAVKRDLWRKAKDAIFLALAPLPPGRAPIEGGSAGPAHSSSTPPDAVPVSPTKAEPSTHSLRSAAAPEASSSHASERHDDSGAFANVRGKRQEALRVALGMGTPYRKLSYSDPLSSALGDYQLNGMPMLDLSVAYYPGRSFTQGWASWLGLDLAAQLALSGSATTDRQGNTFQASYGAYRVGVRVRAPVKKHFVSAFSGYAINRVSFSSETSGIESPVPDTDYRMVRTGAGTELSLTDALALAFDVAWLNVLSVGEIGAWFPRATASGFELAMNASYALGHRMFARASLAYQRTAFDFHPEPGDKKVAGGATDQFLTASLGIGVGI